MSSSNASKDSTEIDADLPGCLQQFTISLTEALRKAGEDPVSFFSLTSSPPSLAITHCIPLWCSSKRFPVFFTRFLLMLPWMYCGLISYINILTHKQMSSNMFYWFYCISHTGSMDSMYPQLHTPLPHSVTFSLILHCVCPFTFKCIITHCGSNPH